MSLNIGFNEERYVKLLTNLIGETKYLQDKPPRHVPEEDRCETMNIVIFYFINSFCCVMYRAIKHLLEVLKPYTKENGGLLKVEHVSYVEGRGNLIIEYENVRPYHIRS